MFDNRKNITTVITTIGGGTILSVVESNILNGADKSGQNE